MRNRLIITLLIFFVSCSSSPVPRDILPPEKMQKVVYDLVRVDEFISEYVSKDSTVNLKKKRSILYEEVFKADNTDRKQFYTSYRYYQRHPDVQKWVFDSLYEDLNRKKVEVVDTSHHAKPAG